VSDLYQPVLPGPAGPDSVETATEADVLRVRDLEGAPLQAFYDQCGLELTLVTADAVIPGSHWGDDEAGLIGDRVFYRDDTPVHSLLHESCHWLLMDSQRRSSLHTDAGGTSLEECAVCFLQILLAEQFPPMDRARMFVDMDRWGYSFRCGSTTAWFDTDAEDALHFLLNHVLMDQPSILQSVISHEQTRRAQ